MFTQDVRAHVERLKELRYRQLAARLEGKPVEMDELAAAVDRLLIELEAPREAPAFYGSEIIIRPVEPPMVGEPVLACH